MMFCYKDYHTNKTYPTVFTRTNNIISQLTKTKWKLLIITEVNFHVKHFMVPVSQLGIIAAFTLNDF